MGDEEVPPRKPQRRTSALSGRSRWGKSGAGDRGRTGDVQLGKGPEAGNDEDKE